MQIAAVLLRQPDGEENAMKSAEDRMAAIRKLYAQLPGENNKYEVHQEERMLPVSDGVHLRTQFWFPENRTSFPCVVTRSCYPHQEVEFAVHGEEYARRGFGFVVQWCRGTNGSEGKWEPNTYERQDGLDTMNYLAALPQVKTIGYWGNSYLASTGWCMADAVPEKVKSMYLGVYGTDRYTSVYQDGLFRQDIFTWWSMTNAGKKVQADYLESCRYRPQMEVDEALWGVHLDWYRNWIGNTDRDSTYWSQEGFWKMLSEIPEKIRIPIFIRDGWYDHHLGSAMVSWNRLSKEAAAHSTLQLGPWRHEYDYALDGQNTENLRDDSVESPLRWFTETLEKEELPERSCELYVIGADRWIRQKELPEKGETETLYLDAALFHEGSAVLSKETASPRQVTYLYDPENPVMSHGTESCFKSKREIGSLWQPECGYRPDVLSFVSQVYEEPIGIVGNIEVILFVSSDAEDTAFTAKIMEVFEDGSCVNIRGNITTLAYRNGAGTRKTYIPGEVKEIHLTMWPIAWKTHRNSRIRVDISSSDFPQYAVHSNYPGVWSEQEKTKCAHQTIYTGEGTASRVVLPLMKV